MMISHSKFQIFTMFKMCFKLWRKVKTLDKIESGPEKTGVSLCGLIAFTITITICLMYYMRWQEAKDLGEDYYCSDYRVIKEKADDPYFVPENVGEGWTKAFLHNYILYGILSFFNVLAECCLIPIMSEMI